VGSPTFRYFTGIENAFRGLGTEDVVAFRCLNVEEIVIKEGRSL
jgi:hypothetical protein